MKKLRVTVDGKVFEVTVELLDEDPAPEALPAPAAAHPPTPVPLAAPVADSPPARDATRAGTAPGDVRSPLAGKIVSIDASPGHTVTQGQQILTLEAMKMNTYIYAPKSGRVCALHAHPGDAVEEGALLMSIA